MITTGAVARNYLFPAMSWWCRELNACYSSWWNISARKGARKTAIQIADGKVTFYRLSQDRLAEVKSIELHERATDYLAAKAGFLLHRARLPRHEIVFCVPKELTLQLLISLPLVTEENLNDVIMFEMERYVAFSSEDVYFHFCIVDRNAVKETLSINLLVVPRKIIDPLLLQIGTWGLKPTTLAFPEHDGSIRSYINLPSKVKASKTTRRIRMANLGLTFVVIFLASLSLYLEFYNQERVITAYHDRIDEARSRSLDVEALRAELAKALARNRFLIEQRVSRPFVVNILDELSHKIPDDTWVTQIRMQQDEITLSGYSPAASTLIEVLESSSEFSEVRFASPVTLDVKQGVERFNLMTRIRRGGEL